MKFDAVIGNPPYSDGLNKRFYQKFVRLAKAIGHKTAMVVPATMFSNPKELDGIQVYRSMGSGYFDAGIQVCYFVTGMSSQTLMIAQNGDQLMVEQPKYAIGNSLIQYQLFDKLAVNDGLELVTGKLYEPHAIPDDNGVWCIHTSGGLSEMKMQQVCASQRHLLAAFDNHKVVFTGAAEFGSLSTPKYAKPGYGVSATLMAIVVDDESQAHSLISYLQSKVVAAMLAVIKASKKNSTKSGFKLIPKVALDRIWTDEELYEHFGLTKEEIDHISKR
jgi:hypothetical protein